MFACLWGYLYSIWCLSCSCINANRYRCSREIMTIFQRTHILACTRMQLVVIQTTFWLMEMGNQLLGFKITFVLMVHTDGIIIWKPQSMLISYWKKKKISIMTKSFIIGFLMSILYACNGYYQWDKIGGGCCSTLHVCQIFGLDL